MAKNNQDDSDFDFEDTEHEEDSEFDFGDDSDFNFDDDESELEETQHTEEHESSHEEAEAPPPPQKTASQPPKEPSDETPEVQVGKEEMVTSNPKDIPLHIAVEVGRFNMTVEKMLELQPGNLLNLHIRPEDGVDLVVNGKRVGKGELLKFGDTLGIRITEVG